MRRQSKIPLSPRPSFEAKAKAKDRTVEAKAKAKDTKFCPRGSSRPRPGLEDYITVFLLPSLQLTVPYPLL